jgi:enoyl-CoA hydratase/carnithine racemase
MLTGEHIRVAREGAVGVLTIDRRERMNALDVQTAQDLRRAALGLARDEAVRCVVLAGVDGVFCTGADLKYVRAGGVPDEVGYLTPGAREQPPGFG